MIQAGSDFYLTTN